MRCLTRLRRAASVLAVVAGVLAGGAHAGEGESSVAKAVRSGAALPESELGSGAALPTCDCTVTHAVRTFASYVPPEAGDALVIDLNDPGRDWAVFFDPDRNSHVPLPGSLSLRELERHPGGELRTARFVADGEWRVTIDIESRGSAEARMVRVTFTEGFNDSRAVADCTTWYGAAWLTDATVVLAYDDFGPQAAAHGLLGMDWWQWERHGDSRSRDHDVKVVVYRDVSLAAVKWAFPVMPAKEQDFRYVSLADALAYLDAEIERDVLPTLTARLLRTRSMLTEALSRRSPEQRSPLAE